MTNPGLVADTCQKERAPVEAVVATCQLGGLVARYGDTVTRDTWYTGWTLLLLINHVRVNYIHPMSVSELSPGEQQRLAWSLGSVQAYNSQRNLFLNSPK